MRSRRLRRGVTERTAGIHHVTAVSGEPQATVDFYTDVLGLRLVKQTVNFDDTTTYHLYFGDGVGSPGTAFTVFPFPGASRGSPGRGQATETAFAVPPGTLDYWADRLAAHDVAVGERTERFGDPVLPFTDGDGQPLALVETAATDGVEPWPDGPVPGTNAVRGFAGMTLASGAPDETGRILETLGFDVVDETDDRRRYRAEGDRATTVDVRLDVAPRGRPGAGTVHHVAFRTPDDETQAALRDRLAGIGVRTTPQRDRQYFRSLYFREPGGILFEIATDVPGFTLDEDRAALGTALQVPPWLADDREAIAASLPPLGVAEPVRETAE
jgi:glyoxalase family protein